MERSRRAIHALAALGAPQSRPANRAKRTRRANRVHGAHRRLTDVAVSRRSDLMADRPGSGTGGDQTDDLVAGVPDVDADPRVREGAAYGCANLGTGVVQVAPRAVHVEPEPGAVTRRVRNQFVPEALGG